MKKLSVILFLICVSSLIIFNQCKISNGKVTLDVNAKPFEKLSEYNFFKGTLKDLIPNDRVLPYDLITALFSDYAHKARFVWMPEGTSAKYEKDEVLGFPVGTVLIKNFFYENDETNASKGRKIMETRLLVKRADKWDALDYVWNDEQSEAKLNIVGDSKKVDFINAHGKNMHIDYSVPNKNQCKNCHNLNNVQMPIGPKVRYLNKDFKYADGTKNQLDKWAEIGYLTGYKKEDNFTNKIADAFDEKSGTLEARAKSYLEVNCAHCHRKEGSANTSGLFLLLSEKNPESWGIMKSPVAAGAASGDNLYDIVPGKPDESILVYRMTENDPEIRMPELGRSVQHSEAVELIRKWVAEMK
ncbi:MAG TPA: SO2930 family diheme c-type cytochrome [Chitinophagales bacterium]|nr:SO2930 family diheme c-type cytochrome [Chitinophagales bacterium]